MQTLLMIFFIWKDKFFLRICSFFCLKSIVFLFLLFLYKLTIYMELLFHIVHGNLLIQLYCIGLQINLRSIGLMMPESLHFLFLWIFNTLNTFLNLWRYLLKMWILRLFKGNISRVEINYSFYWPFLQFIKLLLCLQEIWWLLSELFFILRIVLFNKFQRLFFVII